MSLELSQRVRELGRQAQEQLQEQFAHIDAVAAANTMGVANANALTNVNVTD